MLHQTLCSFFAIQPTVLHGQPAPSVRRSQPTNFFSSTYRCVRGLRWNLHSHHIGIQHTFLNTCGPHPERPLVPYCDESSCCSPSRSNATPVARILQPHHRLPAFSTLHTNSFYDGRPFGRVLSVLDDTFRWIPSRIEHQLQRNFASTCV